MITIITTAYKNEEFIIEALDSIIKSAGSFEFEILLGIDNCEITLNTIRKHIKKYENQVKVYFFDDKPGTYVIRNSLVLESKYDNIIFFDSDDIMRDNMVSDILFYLKTFDVVRPMFKAFKNELPQDITPTYQYSFGAFAIKKNAFLNLNGFEPWVCAADGEFIWRLESNKVKIKPLQKLSFFYRRHNDSLTTTIETNMTSNLRKGYHKIKEEKKINNNFHKLPKLIKSDFRLLTFLPKFSIIIPTFDDVNYLDECLKSIIKSIKNIECEILVGIDNCNITLEYINKNSFDYRIRFFSFKNNVGPYVIKNSLSEISNSDFLLFFDSDDIMIELLIQDIMSYKSVYTLIKPMYLDFNDDIKNINNRISETKTYGEGVFGIDKKTFLNMNGFEGWRCAADSELMTRLYKNKVKLMYTKNIGFYRRVHKKSLTKKSDTGYSSKLRRDYIRLMYNKTDFGPLPQLITEPYSEILVDKFKITINEEFILRETTLDLVNNFYSNGKKFNSVNDINYESINNIQNKDGVYQPKKDVKPIKEYIPKDRNYLIEIKKGSLADQAIKMNKTHPNRRNNLPNIFSDKKR